MKKKSRLLKRVISGYRRIKRNTTAFKQDFFPTIRSKLYGLNVLKEACKGTNSTVLPWKTYSSPKQFSLRDFGSPTTGRIIVRTDWKRKSKRSRLSRWQSLPRKNFNLSKNSEADIKKWMNKQRMHYRNLIFAVHKVPELKEYKQHIRINVNLRDNQIDIRVSGRLSKIFRQDSITASTLLPISKWKKEHKTRLSNLLKSKKLAENISKVLFKLIKEARQKGELRFETNAVTYKNNLESPEFYDLLFGKEFIDFPSQGQGF